LGQPKAGPKGAIQGWIAQSRVRENRSVPGKAQALGKEELKRSLWKWCIETQGNQSRPAGLATDWEMSLARCRETGMAKRRQ